MNTIEKLSNTLNQFLEKIGEELAVEADVDALYMGDFVHELYQVIAERFAPAFRFEINSCIPDEMEYKGRRLFDGNACLLYAQDDWACEAVSLLEVRHSIELWIKEDLSLIAVANCTIAIDEADYEATYREVICDGWPNFQLPLDIDAFVNSLHYLHNTRKDRHGIFYREV